ncbi:A disintegrin and metalloproteinase with thrombospondin motifs 20 [Magallana gigas]|uniref:A disintegrin and metalloproteinase with thrombospondin motifs 20 n=1 Tax=Magallana gigas TaxID=29159 RepID=UPI0033414627
MNLIAKLLVLLFISTTMSPGNTNEIYFTKTVTRLDLVEPSLGIWSGPRFGTSQCSFTCLQEPQCVSLLFNGTTKLCYLFNVIFDGDESGNVDSYWVINNGNTRFVPASCIDLLSCAVNTSDGEYWIYPIAANGRRTKIFCHDMATGPSHFITLKNTNSFIEHDGSNWIVSYQQCQSKYKSPLKRVEFTKIKIRIEDMEVEGTDYTFTSVTGSPTIKYGEAADCNGEYFRDPCPHFGHAIIDTRGTGLIVDPTVVFGTDGGFETRATNFLRSADGSEISFSCAGWCGECGPVSGPIKLVHSVEFISATDAQLIVCHK